MINKNVSHWYHPKSLLDRFFSVGIILKGLDGLIELLTAFALIFLNPNRLQHLVTYVTQGEISEDPHDFIANLLIHSSTHFASNTRLFLIIYLAIHAAVKLTAVIGILRNKLWAYPFSLIALGVLALYQLYDIIFVKLSTGMVLLTVLDLVILWLILREYGKIRRDGFPSVNKQSLLNKEND